MAMNATVHTDICNRLISIDHIKKHLVSVIWYGSASSGQDLHIRSDCDLQIVLDKPDFLSTVALNTILEDYPHVDLSIVYLKDISYRDGTIIFQNGTKGLFFLYILANGKAIYGENIYKSMIESLAIEEIKSSLAFTIREYLSRLRIMATHNPNDTFRFKKYSLKLLKDLLIYSGSVELDKIVSLNYTQTLLCSLKFFNFCPESNTIIGDILFFDKNYTKNDMANLLCDYEDIVEKILHE